MTAKVLARPCHAAREFKLLSYAKLTRILARALEGVTERGGV